MINVAIENGLKRFESGLKLLSNTTISLKNTRIGNEQRFAMSYLYKRLKGNENNEMQTGVELSLTECEILGLGNNGCKRNFYHLDRSALSNKRIIIFTNEKD